MVNPNVYPETRRGRLILHLGEWLQSIGYHLTVWGWNH